MKLKNEGMETDYAACDIQKTLRVLDEIFESEYPINRAQNHPTLFTSSVLSRQIDSSNPTITVLTYMLKKGGMKAIEVLDVQANLLTEAFLNQKITEGPNTGKTLLWSIAESPEGCHFLSQNPELLSWGNFDAAPSFGPDAGKTALWLIAASQDGRQLLVEHSKLLYRSYLDAAPIQDAGKTILWLLAASSEGYPFLLQHPKLLMKSNVNTTQMQGPFAGSTVLWWFALSSDGREFLLQNPALLKEGNLDAALITGEEIGKTILWRFIANSDRSKFLLQHFELLCNSNLNVAPTRGPWAGETVLWLLASSPEGRQFLLKYPELLRKYDLSTSPTQGKYMGKTVTYCLVEAGLENEVLGASKSNFIDLSASYKAKDKQENAVDITLLETLIKQGHFDAIKKLIALYLEQDKQDELDFLVNKIPFEIGWQITWLINLIDAETYYTDLMMLEDIEEIQPVAEKILEYINDVDGESYYYKAAQHLKAMTLSYTHQFKCPTLPSQELLLGCAQTYSPGVNNLLEMINALYNAGRYDDLLLLLCSRLRAEEFTENKPEEIFHILSSKRNVGIFFKNQSINGNDNKTQEEKIIEDKAAFIQAKK